MVKDSVRLPTDFVQVSRETHLVQDLDGDADGHVEVAMAEMEGDLV